MSDVTLRDAIDGLLANPEPGVDPSAALAEAGFGDVSPELFGTALSHFADSAPLPAADALAPIVTRVGPVPFEDSDLPDADLEPGLDPFDMFAEVNPDPAAFVDAEPTTSDLDADPSDLDVGSTVDTPTMSEVDTASQFGSGVDETSTEPDDLQAFASSDDANPDMASFGPDDDFDDGFDAMERGDEIDDEGSDLFSVDFDDTEDDGADPLDLDFEG